MNPNSRSFTAAKEMKVPMIVPMLATRSIEEVAQAAGRDTVLWFQVYVEMKFLENIPILNIYGIIRCIFWARSMSL